MAQWHDGYEHVIAFTSRSLYPTEKNDANYSSFKLQVLALKWATIEKFKDCLTWAKFTVYTVNDTFTDSPAGGNRTTLGHTTVLF